MLTSGRVAGLQHLAVPIPGGELQHLERLNALAALTSLHLRLWESLGCWSSLTSLAGLKHLRMESKPLAYPSASTILTPLVALQGLTYLDAYIKAHAIDPAAIAGCDFSVLSPLTALRALTCPAWRNAMFAGEDPLPIQLRFLKTATALELLDLRFLGSFWTLPLTSILAMQQAVSSLASLKTVAIGIVDTELEHYSSPFAVFAAATSIEWLFFESGGCGHSLPDKTHDLARACFKRLQKLKNFTQWGATAPSQFHELLLDLSSTQLTKLHINVEFATVPLMEHIAGFSTLQELNMVFRDSSLMFLGPLLNLKELTFLDLKFIPQQQEEAREGELECHHGKAAHVIREQWTRLSAAIKERVCRVGVEAYVRPI